jgi:hypothetical protein
VLALVDKERPVNTFLRQRKQEGSNRRTVGESLFREVRAEAILGEPIGEPPSDPCGGGLEYRHRSLASRKRRQKGNPFPGGIAVPPYSWGIYS